MVKNCKFGFEKLKRNGLVEVPWAKMEAAISLTVITTRLWYRGTCHGKKIPTLKNFLISDGHSTAPESLVPSAAKDMDTDVLGISDQLKLVAHKKHFYEMPFFGCTTGMGIDVDPFWYRVMALFVGTLTRPWWKRVWIVEEAILSTHAPLRIGTHQFVLAHSCSRQ